MKQKENKDHNRYRNVNVGFRVTPQEADEIHRAALLSGMKKQDYILKRLRNHEIVVVPNSRLYKLIIEQTEYLATELTKLIRSGKKIDPELKATVELLITTLNGMKGDAGDE